MLNLFAYYLMKNRPRKNNASASQSACGFQSIEKIWVHFEQFFCAFDTHFSRIKIKNFCANLNLHIIAQLAQHTH